MQRICITIRVETGLGQFAYLGQIGRFSLGHVEHRIKQAKLGFNFKVGGYYYVN